MTLFSRAVYGLTVALLVWLSTAVAQTQTEVPDYTAWQPVAERAEAAVEAARASDEVFGQLRSEVAGWRQKFQAQLTANDSRLTTLREQITALGPVPEEGQTEAAEIAARRSELNAQLERLSTPRRTAEEAFSRAAGIIAEIDEIVRARQAEELLRMGPWPINPTYWAPAARALQDTVISTVAGVQTALRTPSRVAGARDNLPLILFLLALGGVLLARSRYWSEWLAVRIQRDRGSGATDVAGFFVSLGQIVLPMLGLWALVRAIVATGVYGQRGGVILDTLEPMGLIIFFALWLASRVFPRASSVPSILNFPDERRAEARINIVAIAVVYAILLLVNRLADADRYSIETMVVLRYPLIVVAGLLLMRLGWLLRRTLTVAPGTDGPEPLLPKRFIGILGRLTVAVGFAGPLLATFGYGTAAAALVFPTAATLAVCGTVMLLQRLVRDAYGALIRTEGASDGLIPTLIGFGLVLAAAPVLSLIWGARITDLVELWNNARAGISIGDTVISPGSFFTLIVVFVLGYLITRGVQSAMRTSVLPKTKIDPGGQTAIVSGLGYIGIFLAALVAITSAGLDLSSLAIVAGALSVGIGFGLQTVVSNFVSGIILLIERPISEGDWIEVGGQMGYVRSISVRSTRIETFDRTDVIVPNADLVSGTVTNYTRGNTVGRVIIPVGVAYGTDTRRVEKILREIAEAHPMALMNPPPMILFAGFGADSLDFEIRIILRDVNWGLSVRNEINHQIAARFIDEGIEIPFAQRDIWLRNPEALRSAPSPAAAPPAATPPDPGPAAPASPEHLTPEDLDPDADGDAR